MQIEQDMGLINTQVDVRVQFLKTWIHVITAILSYGESGPKKNVCKLMQDLDESGMQTRVS